MKIRSTLRIGTAIVAVAAGAFALVGSAGAGGPTGQRIAYMSAWDGEADIYAMEMHGLTPPINLTHDKLIGQRQDVEPAWSPDGRYVAFQRTFATSVTHWNGSGIFLVTADGKKLGRLVPPAARDGVFDMHPAWSPDGTVVVFSSNRDGNFELYAAKSSGGGLVKLTDTKPWVSNLQPAWSPKGDSIVFSRRTATAADSAALFVLKLSTGKVSRLTKTSTVRGDREPAWSPDGRQIAFTSDRTGNDDLFVVNTWGGGLVQLTTSSKMDTHPTWAPSGKTLAFVSDRSGATEIYTLDLAGRNDRLTQVTFDKAFKSNPSWERVGLTD